MGKLVKLGKFLRILDDRGNLSITNIASIIVLVKIAIAPSASIIELGGLLVTLGNYSYKKKLESK